MAMPLEVSKAALVLCRLLHCMSLTVRGALSSSGVHTFSLHANTMASGMWRFHGDRRSLRYDCVLDESVAQCERFERAVHVPCVQCRYLECRVSPATKPSDTRVVTTFDFRKRREAVAGQIC